MIVRPLSRRTLLRGAGVCMALPFLEAMTPSRAKATSASAQRFIAFFYPNGTDPPKWNPPAGALVALAREGVITSRNGSAMDTPAPRRRVRRERGLTIMWAVASNEMPAPR